MRLFAVLFALALAFGLAALWQRHKVDELRAARERASRVAAGVLAETPSGDLRRGKGVVIVGRPSGVDPLPVPGGAGGEGAAGVPSDAELSGGELSGADAARLADFVMEVRSGQTLSGIAAAIYGTAPAELVRRLAAYNGMEDPDELRAGQRLLLPPLERLP